MSTDTSHKHGHEVTTTENCAIKFTFGRHMKPFFYNREDFININHGSFGTTPRVIMEALHKYQIEMETSCDKFFRETAIQLYKNSVGTISDFVNAPAEDVALVDNASVGVNAVLRSLPVLCSQQQCSILYTSIAYPMVRQLLYYMRDMNPNLTLIEVPLNHTTMSSHERIIEAFRETIIANKQHNIVLSIFDHIVSMPSIILPVKELSQLCRENNILTMIDGAHAAGQIPVDIRDLNVDFYTSNMHKWLFVPKVCAFLYVRNELRTQVRPTVVSWGYATKKFDDEFFWTGTRDMSAMFCVVDSIKWRQEIGGEEAINKYCNELAVWAGDHLAGAWNTEVLFKENRDTLNAALTNVLLPVQDKVTIDAVVQVLMDDYNSFMATCEFDGKWYTRISCQIYNTKEEMMKIGASVNEIIQGLKNDTIKLRSKQKGMF